MCVFSAQFDFKKCTIRFRDYKLKDYLSILYKKPWEELGNQFFFIGQPVDYHGKAFIRLAVGARTIRKFIQDDEQEFKFDLCILKIIANHLHLLNEN